MGRRKRLFVMGVKGRFGVCSNTKDRKHFRIVEL